jgi:ABC-2 type transport system permease protein
VTPNVRTLMLSLFRQRKHRLRIALNENRLQSAFVMMFLMSFFLMATGLFNALFKTLKVTLSLTPELIPTILNFVIPLLFSCLFVMLCFSNGIMSWVSLFRDKESNSLLVWPLDVKEIYFVKFIESFFFSAWAFFFLAGPLFLGFAFQFEVPLMYYPSTMLLSVSFAIMAGCGGTFIAIMIARFLPRYRKHFLTLTLLVVGGILFWFFVTYMNERGNVNTSWFMDLAYNFNFMLSGFSPPAWMYRGFQAACDGDATTVAFMFCLLLSHGLLLLHVGGLILSKSYLMCRENIFVGKKKYRKGFSHGLVGPASNRSVTWLLMWKDAKIFVRDPAQWLQLLLFFGLLFVYFSNLTEFNIAQNNFGIHYISTLNLSATLLTLSTFTTRFVFPQLSLEGKRFWFLGLVPLSRKSIIWGKFVFAFIGCFLIAGTLTLVSVNELGLSPLQIPIQLALSFSVSLGLVGMACGMGVIFANYKAESATKVLSGFGGTLNLVLSALFLTLEMFLIYPAIKKVNEWEDFLDPMVAFSFTICLLLGFMTAFVPMYYGNKHFEKIEF